ncbi:MAG: 4-hydroxy-tetrahydrodipicolinate synthase [Clostridia bacterium]|nr:4-hydroxy-tetrahydrodipicolinate synthase [Clostridia bacterium]
MKTTVFSGVCTALITPFRDGKIDFEALRGLIKFQIDGGVNALLINGTTGESATLTDAEKREIISFTVSEVGGRVPVIAGTGSNDTKKAVELSKFAYDVGADACLVVTPYYNKASEAGLIKHYEAIADATKIPIMLYNVPSRTGVNIPLSIYKKLSEHKNIVAVKEANPSVSDFARLSARCGKNLDLYSGNDDLILPSLSLGGKGVISVISNALPKQTGEICRLWFGGKIKEATELQLKLLPLINAIFCEVNPIPIKALLSHLGFCKEEYRLPLCPMDSDRKMALIKEYLRVGF